MHLWSTFKLFAQFWTRFEEKLWTKIASANLTCDTELLFWTKISDQNLWNKILDQNLGPKSRLPYIDRFPLTLESHPHWSENRFRGTSVRRL